MNSEENERENGSRNSPSHVYNTDGINQSESRIRGVFRARDIATSRGFFNINESEIMDYSPNIPVRPTNNTRATGRRVFSSPYVNRFYRRYEHFPLCPSTVARLRQDTLSRRNPEALGAGWVLRPQLSVLYPQSQLQPPPPLSSSVVTLLSSSPTPPSPSPQLSPFNEENADSDISDNDMILNHSPSLVNYFHRDRDPSELRLNNGNSDNVVDSERLHNRLTHALEHLIPEIINEPNNLVNEREPSVNTRGQDSVNITAGRQQQQSNTVDSQRNTLLASGLTCDTFSDEKLKKELLRMLECPVCYNYMEPPIPQCKEGHILCNVCKARVAMCPICRSFFTNVRNRPMEDLSRKMPLPCRYACGLAGTAAERRAHEPGCARRRHACPLPECARAAPRDLRQLRQHVQADHSSLVENGNQRKISVRLHAMLSTSTVFFLLDDLFYLRLHLNRGLNIVKLYVVHVGPTKRDTKYNYKVTVAEGHNSKLVYTRETHNDMDDMSNVEDCFFFTLNQISQFAKSTVRDNFMEKNIDFMVEISECDVSENQAVS